MCQLGGKELIHEEKVWALWTLRENSMPGSHKRSPHVGLPRSHEEEQYVKSLYMNRAQGHAETWKETSTSWVNKKQEILGVEAAHIIEYFHIYVLNSLKDGT